KDLISLADLYAEADQPEKIGGIVSRALASKAFSPVDRAGVLVYAVRAGLKEPKSDERNNRLEKYVDELDRATAATFEQKLEAHSQLNGWYRYDDIDAGIIKHSTWIIETARKLTPEQHRKLGGAGVSAY